MKNAFICDAIRTPIGRYGAGLADVRADDLAAIPLRAIIDRNNTLPTELIDDVILGCANQAGEDNRNVARMASLLAGIPYSVAGLTVNRLCGSGLEAVNIAARAIATGDYGIALAGGVESMSRAPYVMGKSDRQFSRNMKIEDTTMGWRFINDIFQKQFGTESMPETAENVAEECGISRSDQDKFAYQSQMRACEARTSSRFSVEICPVHITDNKEQIHIFDKDEHPREATTIESLSKLGTPFREGGTVTAGNASGINDGACALLLAGQQAVEKFDLKARARVVACISVGVEPRLMGLGPVPAINRLLEKTGIRLDEVDVLELNEAFASQALACIRALGLPDNADHVNPNGGAIALGHPLGMSGARLVTTAMNELEIRRGRFAICAMCIGVGQGIAMLIERV